ncbi:MAG: hypothetical protein WBD65_12005 [Methylocella sp.]
MIHVRKRQPRTGQGARREAGTNQERLPSCPRLGSDRNAYARILNALDMITASEISAAMPLPFPRGGV